MDKAIHGADQRRLCELLRQRREDAGLRQADVAARLGVPQSFVSKYESGERRLDLIELRQVCEAIGTTLTDFVTAFEASGRPTKSARGVRRST
jgi:transcriptional regulator with XRE-family HTH domain